MKAIVLMSLNNANLCVGIPLYQIIDEQESYGDCGVSITSNTLIAYAIDVGEGPLALMSADWVEKNLITVGEL
jgi:hypothetical protein